jgi:hypothetical protein
MKSGKKSVLVAVVMAEDLLDDVEMDGDGARKKVRGRGGSLRLAGPTLVALVIGCVGRLRPRFSTGFLNPSIT